MTAKLRWAGILLVLALAGCSVLGEPQVVFTKVLTFKVDKNANQNNPIAMDLVVIHDKKLLAQVIKLSAREWFEQRSQLKLDYPSVLYTWEWEIVPGQNLSFYKLPENSEDAQAILVFANYQAPGPHRVRLDPYEAVVLRLLEKKFLAEPLTT
ncbi:MAG: type VI secretion protein [Gammaproteobacteria bacterium]|nr:type VI secretion protein [Gammaproteobacteria bacterium]